jgi:hypothetical protein
LALIISILQATSKKLFQKIEFSTICTDTVIIQSKY